MESKLVTTKKDNKILTYLIEDDILVNVSVSDSEESLLQNIYIGKVQNIVKNINAAFIEIQKGVICYMSLSESTKWYILNRTAAEASPLSCGDELLVQVIRDPIKTKGATVSTNISLSGKYVVISCHNTRIGYSNKLSNNDKKYFMEKTAGLYNSKYGYVIRTNATILTEKENGLDILKEEIARLTVQMDCITEEAPTRRAYSLIYRSPGRHLEAIKNMYSNVCNKIMTDDKEIYTDTYKYLEAQQPEDLDKLVFYEDDRISMNKLLRLDTRLQEALHKIVRMKSGGYLIIEPTETLTVIDVNTGKYLSGQNREDTYYKINKEAVLEIAHQLRLRNLSGMILVDFINMKDSDKKIQLLQHLREAVSKDPVKTTVLDITALGLIEITRKKMEAPLSEQLSKHYHND